MNQLVYIDGKSTNSGERMLKLCLVLDRFLKSLRQSPWGNLIERLIIQLIVRLFF